MRLEPPLLYGGTVLMSVLMSGDRRTRCPEQPVDRAQVGTVAGGFPQ